MIIWRQTCKPQSANRVFPVAVVDKCAYNGWRRCWSCWYNFSRGVGVVDYEDAFVQTIYCRRSYRLNVLVVASAACIVPTYNSCLINFKRCICIVWTMLYIFQRSHLAAYVKQYSVFPYSLKDLNLWQMESFTRWRRPLLGTSLWIILYHSVSL